MLLVSDNARFARAWDLARHVHRHQTYGTDRPYDDHLFEVFRQVVRSFPDDENLALAAILHDALEDAQDSDRPVDLSPFGPDVESLVRAVTNEPGINRKERNEATYPKIVAAGPRAIALKLCDRIANVANGWAHRDGRLFMYHREYPAFRRALRQDDADPKTLELWVTLDRLLAWRE